MVFVNVLLTAAFLTGAFTGFLWTFFKEKAMNFFGNGGGWIGEISHFSVGILVYFFYSIADVLLDV